MKLKEAVLFRSLGRNFVRQAASSSTWSRIKTNPDCIGTAPDGTLFTDFLFRLNHRCAKDETIPCTRNDDCD